MMNLRIAKGTLALLLLSLGAMNGCSINLGGTCHIVSSEYERTEQLSAPLAVGSLVVAKTHNGSITVTGGEVEECNIIATVNAHAPSEEEAQRLAEETTVTLEPADDGLFIAIKKPNLHQDCSISVNLQMTVPRETHLNTSTHNGSIRLSNLSGKAKILTHNGSVTASDVSGNMHATTHNGSIIARGISGNLQAKTHNGRISASYLSSAPSVRDVCMETHNGSITFAAPANFSASVDASTYRGAIHTDLPFTVMEKVGNRFKGSIGKGEGKLYLKTHNGTIRIERAPLQKNMGL